MSCQGFYEIGKSIHVRHFDHMSKQDGVLHARAMAFKLIYFYHITLIIKNINNFIISSHTAKSNCHRNFLLKFFN